MPNPNTLLHVYCLLGCIVKPLTPFFILLKGHGPFHFHCLLLGTAAARDGAAAVCLCCCFASHQVLRPGVAPFLLLFSCIQQLPDWLAQYWLIKRGVRSYCWSLGSPPGLSVQSCDSCRSEFMSILEDKLFFFWNLFCDWVATTDRSGAAATDVLSHWTMQLILSFIKVLCAVGIRGKRVRANNLQVNVHFWRECLTPTDGFCCIWLTSIYRNDMLWCLIAVSCSAASGLKSPTCTVCSSCWGKYLTHLC